MNVESTSHDDANQIDDDVEHPKETETSHPRPSTRRNSIGNIFRPQEPRTSLVAKFKARRRGSETTGGWTGRRSLFGARRGSGLASLASGTKKLGVMLKRGSFPNVDDKTLSVTSTMKSQDLDDREGSQEKILLGIKHHLGRYKHDDKEVKMSVHMEDMGQICEVESRPSEVISKIRKKIENDTTQAIPSFICFCYSDGNPVESANEATTRAASCRDEEGKLLVCTPEDIADKNVYSLHIVEVQVVSIPNGSDLVVRCCVQLLEEFVTVAKEEEGINRDLPDPLPHCLVFFRDVARAILTLTGTCRVIWPEVEKQLNSIAVELRAERRRDKFVALMSYRSGLDRLRNSIQKIQTELLQSTIADDHAVYFVWIARPSRQVDSLLIDLARTSFLDLCGEKHSKTRHRIATMLSMDEMEVIKRIKSKGVSNVSDADIFRNTVHEASYSSQMDRAMIKDILAPYIDNQNALIVEKAEKFNTRTRQWAMQEFDEWIHNPTSKHRCFLLVGAPASGKSTLISHMVQERSSLILASHYCCHDDNHTVNPKEMLLSISYQLCLQSVAFENKIRALLVGMRTERKDLLSQNYPIASIFRDFLEGPLRDIEGEPDFDQCIVIDGIELGNEGTGERNPLLKVVRSYLSYLPLWIRFVITTTPSLSIIKRLRSFNSKVVQPKPANTANDMREFFYTALSEFRYEDETGRRDTAATLAVLAGGNYVYGTILVAKARMAKDANNRSLLADYSNLDFDQSLEKDLKFVEEGDSANSELFWSVVRMSLVSFRALNKADVIAFADCTLKSLEYMLDRAGTFFLVTDTTVNRVGQKLLEQWLLNRMSLLANENPGNRDKLSAASTRAGFHEGLEACHRMFGQRILNVLNRSRCDSHFEFTTETTREYALKYVFRHLIHGGMELKARELVVDPAILIERVADYDGLLEDIDLFSAQDELAQLLRRALSLSKEAILIDQRQMVSQLVGRLKGIVTEGTAESSVRIEVQDFVRRLENHDYGFDWWCPLTSTWEKAGSALNKRMKGHDGQIQCVALHKDDNLCASASWDGEVKVWNTAIGSCEVTFKGHQSQVWCVDWDHEGLQLVSGGADACLRIWNYEMREPGWVLRGHGDCIFCAKFSPDSTLIASGSKDSQIKIWNVKSGECEHTLDAHDGFVYSVDWKPDGGNRYLCSGGTDNLVRLWDLNTSSCMLVLSGHQDWVRSVAWSTNGRNIFSGSSDQTLIYWDASTGECQQVLMGHSAGIWAVIQSKDGHYVFSASVDQTIKTWECSTWRCDQTMKGHEGPVLSIAVSSDGNKLVSGGSDNVLGLWDCEVERKASGLDGHSKPIWGVDITPDSKYIASASSDHTVRIWNMVTGLVQRVFTGHTGPVWAAKFSHSTQYVATASSDNTAAIYHLTTGGIKFVLDHGDAVWDVTWSKDDESLFTSCRDLVIRRWNTTHGSVVAEYRGHTKAVKALSISMDGMRMASASLDVSIRIWDLSTDRCERVLQRKEAGAVSVKWLNDEWLAAGYTSGCVRLWNANTGQREIGFLPGHSRRTNAVSGSPDGSRIVSVSSDKELRIWNIETEQCERRILGGSGLGIFCVKWSQDGHYIVSAGSDRAIRVWHPETGCCVHAMGGVGGIGIYEVNWSPSGKLAASGSCDRKVEIWNPETGKCLHSLKGHTNWVHAVDWEEGEKRILSRSDDGTARVWNVETGECENVFDDAIVPEGFLISSSGVSKTVDLSGKAEAGNPVGIDIRKARVHADMSCSWIGKTVYFFKLKRSSELQKSSAQFGGNPPDDKNGSLVVELND